jgi:hypothetical protein
MYTAMIIAVHWPTEHRRAYEIRFWLSKITKLLNILMVVVIQFLQVLRGYDRFSANTHQYTRVMNEIIILAVLNIKLLSIF